MFGEICFKVANIAAHYGEIESVWRVAEKHCAFINFVYRCRLFFEQTRYSNWLCLSRWIVFLVATNKHAVSFFVSVLQNPRLIFVFHVAVDFCQSESAAAFLNDAQMRGCVLGGATIHVGCAKERSYSSKSGGRDVHNPSRSVYLGNVPEHITEAQVLVCELCRPVRHMKSLCNSANVQTYCLSVRLSDNWKFKPVSW